VSSFDLFTQVDRRLSNESRGEPYSDVGFQEKLIYDAHAIARRETDSPGHAVML
jgi:hypothetical protein